MHSDLNTPFHALPLQADPEQQTAGAEEFASVLAAVIDPLVDACERSAEALSADVPTRVDEVSRLDPSAHRVYLINCLAAMQATVATRSFTTARVKQLNDMLEAHMAALVGGQVGRLLARWVGRWAQGCVQGGHRLCAAQPVPCVQDVLAGAVPPSCTL